MKLPRLAILMIASILFVAYRWITFDSPFSFAMELYLGFIMFIEVFIFLLIVEICLRKLSVEYSNSHERR